MNEKEKYVEQSTGAEIICHSAEELEFYVAESTKLIKNKHDELLQVTVDNPLYIITKKEENVNEDSFEIALIYDEYYVLFTSETEANKFLDSFMDVGQKNEVTVVRVQDYGELMHRLPISILGDGLIMKRIEHEVKEDNEESFWRCVDIIYDPNNNSKFE